MSFPNIHFQQSDTSTKYAQDLGALLEFVSMINGSLLQFKAYLTNFTQDFQSSWNVEQVYGRLDPIPTFNSTTRKIQLGWDIPAYDVEAAMNNLNKCQSLIQMMYPSYSESGILRTGTDDATQSNFTKANSLSKPPLIKLKFANLVADTFGTGGQASAVEGGLLGWADGVSWSPNLEAGMFVYKLSGAGEAEYYPKLISLSLTFNVLHQGIPVRNNESVTESFPFNSPLKGGANPNVPAGNIGGENNG